MPSFKQKFTRIQEGYSTARRIPRLGRIRLGIKVKNSAGREYPKECDYFVCPPEVVAVYGEYPKELDVMLLSDDTDIVFPQKLAWYGSSKGLKCHGNGQIAERLNVETKQWEQRTCPCEHRKTDETPKGECTETSYLMVMLPKVSVGGCYQITTGSWNSTVDINSGIDFVKELIGRVAMVPLKLKRRPVETHHDGKIQIHFPLSLTLDANIEGINKLREDTTRVLANAHFEIEGPVEDNPVLDLPEMITPESVEKMKIEPKTIEMLPDTIDASLEQPGQEDPDEPDIHTFGTGKVCQGTVEHYLADTTASGKIVHRLIIQCGGMPVDIAAWKSAKHFDGGLASYDELLGRSVIFNVSKGRAYHGKPQYTLQELELNPQTEQPKPLKAPMIGEYQIGPPQSQEEAERMMLMGRGD